MSDYTIPLRNKTMSQSAQTKKLAQSWLSDKLSSDRHALDMGDTQNKVDQRNNILLQNLLGEVTGRGADPPGIVDGKSLFTVRGDEPVIRLDNSLFLLKAEKILPLHKLFKLLHPDSVKIIMNHSVTLKVQRGQPLYKQGEPA